MSCSNACCSTESKRITRRPLDLECETIISNRIGCINYTPGFWSTHSDLTMKKYCKLNSTSFLKDPCFKCCVVVRWHNAMCFKFWTLFFCVVFISLYALIFTFQSVKICPQASEHYTKSKSTIYIYTLHYVKVEQCNHVDLFNMHILRLL